MIARRTPLKRGAPPKRVTPVRRESKRAPERKAKDKAWSFEVRKRAGGRCERCGTPATPFVPLDAHHLLAKGAYAEHRHDLRNGMALCREHHDAASSKRAEFRAWLRELLRDRPEDDRTPFLVMASAAK